MIRDPSDGSVKKHNDAILERMRGVPANVGPANDPDEGRPANVNPRPGPDQNWGLKSLDREPRKPKPAPTAAELREHYAKHNLGFQPKQDSQE